MSRAFPIPAARPPIAGPTIHYFDDQPPAVDETKSLLADKSVLGRLEVPDPLGGGRMHDRVQAAALLRERVGGQKLIEGWIEGPCAEAADLRGINRLMTDFYDDPAFVRDLFDFVVAMGLEFARAQVEAGVDLIGVGDAAASLVGPQIYEEFVRPYEQKAGRRSARDGHEGAAAHLRQHPPHPAGHRQPGLRNGRHRLDGAVGPGPARDGAGSRSGRQHRSGRNASQRHAGGDRGGLGRVPPPGRPRYIVGAGCEVPRDTPEANVRAMPDYARSHKETVD